IESGTGGAAPAADGKTGWSQSARPSRFRFSAGESPLPLSDALVLALVDRRHVAARSPDVELARTADLVFRIGDHLFPLGDPAHRAREREDAGEHRGGDAQRLLHDARVEIDVRVELLLDEILVFERDPLQLL